MRQSVHSMLLMASSITLGVHSSVAIGVLDIPQPAWEVLLVMHARGRVQHFTEVRGNTVKPATS
jgi:hypothetical protein